MRLGMFDPPARVPCAAIPYDGNDCRRAPRAGAAGRSRIDRAAQERGRPPAALEGRRQHRGDRPERRRPARAGRQLLRRPVARGHAARRDPRGGLAAHEGDLHRRVQAAHNQDARTGAGRGTSPRRSASRSARTSSCCAWACPRRSRASKGTPATRRRAATRSISTLPGLQQRMLEMIVGAGETDGAGVLAGSALDLTWAEEHVAGDRRRLVPGRRRRARRWPTSCSATSRRPGVCRSRSRDRWTTSRTSAATR